MKHLLFCSLILTTIHGAPPPAQSFVNFESPQARPIAISADGLRLFAVNTPDHRLAVWSVVQPAAPVLVKEIRVGLEPVSVAVRTKDEVWVVNHASDSVSVVSLSRGAVVETLRTGDEPGDVVFAGTPQRAFVSSMTERAVHVYDPATRRQVGKVDVFGDDPRALLASPDGKTVWVAITRSGNKTTIVPHTIAPPPPRPTNPRLPLAPRQGIIVDSDDATWKSRLNVTLPDNDVLEIDTATLRVRRSYRGVGTILFNLALRPGTNELWVANTEARNLVRFEPVLKGHAIDSRVTRIVTGATPSVTPVDLNPGIDYSKLPNAAALSSALSQPADVAFAPDGNTAYVAAFGTDRIGVLDTAGRVTAFLEIGDTPGTKVAPRTKRGPRGLVHHPTAATIYVLNRLSNSLSVVDTARRRVVRELAMFDPTPQTIREGRGFLFDAKLSGNGTMSCAACHIDGRHDGVAWDLGDPGGQMFSIGTGEDLHPMKGPLLTQTLQGFKGERTFHWRADRPGLEKFNGAFATLMGGRQLSQGDLDTFVGYMQDIPFMPSPHRNLDDTLPATPVGASAKDGERIFLTKRLAKDRNIRFRCIDCHSNASGSGAIGFQGLIGQQTKAAHLRGLYKRDGRKKVGAERTAGFGFGADGSKDDVAAFLSSSQRFDPLTGNEKKALERFLFAFPSGTAPAVGYSRTVTARNATAREVIDDVNLLLAQASAGNCDLVLKGFLQGRPVGLFYNTATQRFDRDRSGLAALTLADLANALTQQGSVVTFLGVPPGHGHRIGVDRNGNGVLDGDEGAASYGLPSPACAPFLRLAPNAPPRVGSTGFAAVASGGAANGAGSLLLSGLRAQVRIADLDLLVDPAAGVLLAMPFDACREAVLPLPLPGDARLVGLKLRLQAIAGASCGRIGLRASAGLELTLLR